MKKNNIILQQDNKDTLSKKLDGLIAKINTKIDLSNKLKDNVVKQIKETMISNADDNNYWQNIFGTTTQNDNKDDQFSDNLVYESKFVSIFNSIINEDDNTKQNNKTDADNSKENNDKSDLKSKLDDAAKSSDSSGSSDQISLIVTGPDDFEFQNSNGQRFQSKQSLQKLDSFLKKNTDILKAAIQKGEKENAQGKAQALNEAIQFIKSDIFNIKVYRNEKQNININTLIELIKKCEASTWRYVAKQHKFGDRLKNKIEYQKLYYILVGSLISYIAIKNKGKVKTNSKSQLGKSNFNSLSIVQISKLIEQKIKQAGKNPKDKKYLESLLNNKKWLQERTPKYEEALKILIDKAK